MRTVVKKIEKKDLHPKPGSRGRKMAGDDSKKSKRVRSHHRRTD